jgi:hypothetical protein
MAKYTHSSTISSAMALASVSVIVVPLAQLRLPVANSIRVDV